MHISLTHNLLNSKIVEVAGERLACCVKNVILAIDGISSAANIRENGGKDELIEFICVN